MATELELKYSVADKAFPSPAELEEAATRGGWSLQELGEVRHHDSYFDDEHRSLRRAGMALRKRTSHCRTLATLKSAGRTSGALHEREELELPMAGSVWPSEIISRVSSVASPASLRLCLEIVAKKTRFFARHDSGLAAELSCDEVEATRPGLSTRAHFLELEIEATERRAQGLDSLAQALADLITMTASSTNKLERAEALLELAAHWEQP